MGWWFRVPLYRQTDDELSRHVVKVRPLFTHILVHHLTAIPGPPAALEKSLVVEVFKVARSRVFDEPAAKY